jgi:hypothetical protein
LSHHYDRFLKTFQGVKPRIAADTDYNYAYYPLFLIPKKLLLGVCTGNVKPELDTSTPLISSVAGGFCLTFILGRGVRYRRYFQTRACAYRFLYTLSNEEMNGVSEYILRVQNN